MQFIKSFTIIASLALALGACSGTSDSPNNDQFSIAGAIHQSSDALSNCGGFWGWLTNSNCNQDVDAEKERCLGLTNAPGSTWESPGRWVEEERACYNKWPSPICYGMLMNSCENTGTDATHQCSSWNLACRAMCSKWDGMRFGNYCSNDWWKANP